MELSYTLFIFIFAVLECETASDGDAQSVLGKYKKGPFKLKKNKNECRTGAHDCDVHATCTNTMKSYTCKCNTGYTGDGKTCTEIGGGDNTCKVISLMAYELLKKKNEELKVAMHTLDTTVNTLQLDVSDSKAREVNMQKQIQKLEGCCADVQITVNNLVNKINQLEQGTLGTTSPATEPPITTEPPTTTTTAAPTTTSTLPSTTTTGFTCTSDGIFPMPGCTGYIVCLKNPTTGGYYVYTYDCPKGTLYDENLEHCVWETLAPHHCNPTTTTEVTTLL